MNSEVVRPCQTLVQRLEDLCAKGPECRCAAHDAIRAVKQRQTAIDALRDIRKVILNDPGPAAFARIADIVRTAIPKAEGQS